MGEEVGIGGGIGAGTGVGTGMGVGVGAGIEDTSILETNWRKSLGKRM